MKGIQLRIILSLIAVVASANFVYADDAKALQYLVERCADRVHTNIFRAQSKLSLAGGLQSDATYHDSEIEMSGRPGSDQVFVTGPTGRDFGMINFGAPGFGFSRSRFQIHNMSGADGELRAVKFDGFGEFAIGVFASPLVVGDATKGSALVLVPLHITNEHTGEMAPLSADVLALKIENPALKIKFWAQEGTRRFYKTDGSNEYSTFEITPAGGVSKTGEYKFEGKEGTSPELKIHQIGFLADSETAVVHFQFGAKQEYAIALAKADEDGRLDIAFETTTLLRDGKAQPLSIAVQPYSDLIYINYENAYDVLNPAGSQSAFQEVGTFEHPLKGIRAINFHWSVNEDRQLVVTPTFSVPASDAKKTQVLWGNSRTFQMPEPEEAHQEPAKVEAINVEPVTPRPRAEKPRVVLKVDHLSKIESDASDAEVEDEEAGE